MRLSVAFALSSALFGAPPVATARTLEPIVRRADRPDSLYLQLGARFPGVIALGRLGDATLIAPDWLLTAAHVGRAFAGRSGTVTIGGREYPVAATIVHPGWRDMAPHDIALIRLSRPVVGVDPLPIARGADNAGGIATIVGHGSAGVGADRVRLDDGRLRAATSRIDSVDANWLYLSFDAPPAGTELEGAPGRGDSGGPALIARDGRQTVAGVSSAGFDGRLGPGTYGAVDVFTRVSRYVPWIDSVMARTAQPAQDGATIVTAAGRRADSVLSAAAARGFTGVALIHRGGTTILRKGYGLANAAERTPFTPATVVQIGSNTKDFTKIAALQLMARGRLSLDDTIGRFFPGVPADKRTITVRHLMEHRAGLPLGAGNDFEPITRPGLLARVMAAPLDARPGERERYSNVGYSLLAAIIEITSGQTYDEYVRDQILRPAGLNTTGTLLPAFPPSRVAHGYAGGRDQGTMLAKPHASDGPHWNLRGNGGMLSTADDMLRFYHALFNTATLLPARVRDEHFPDGPSVFAGSDLVNFFLYHREPADSLEIIIASTTAEHQAPAVERDLMPLFGFQGPPQRIGGGAAPQPIDLPTTTLGRVVAEYLREFNDGDSTSRARFFRDRVVPQPSGAGAPIDRVARTQQVRSQLGRFIPVAFKEIAPNRAEVSVTTGSGDPATIVIDIEPDQPYRIVSIKLTVG